MSLEGATKYQLILNESLISAMSYDREVVVFDDTKLSIMACVCKVQLKTVKRCVAATLLALLLAGHAATLAISHHRGTPGGGEDGQRFGVELVVGGAVLFSVLPLLALGRLIPDKATLLCRMWL